MNLLAERDLLQHLLSMKNAKHRIESIDILRGVVMVIMALDHVRNYFNYGSFFIDATNLATTTPALFFTRWLTHFCAPVFVFLAGTSAFLYGTRRENSKEISWFLFTRGIWLIILELTVVNFAWTFDIAFTFHIFQVIWAIGFSMIALSVLIYLPKNILLIVGIILVAGHNLLDAFKVSGAGLKSYLWYFLHQRAFLPLENSKAIYIAYPVIPWIGLMVLGYLFGQLYQKGYDPEKRKKLLLWMGAGTTLLFLSLRATNIYGDMRLWHVESNLTFTILSFIKTTKYPPSLLFLAMTIGPALIFLYAVENLQNRFTRMMVIIGRVPLFFYVAHLYLIHLLAIPAAVYDGRPWTDMILTAAAFMKGGLATYGFDLIIVWIVWIFVVVLLYPFCRWYNGYKSSNREKWWLSYL